MTRCFSYLRVSGKGQVEGDGFPRQRESIAKFARANGLEIVEEFRDEGVSGTNEMADRPGLASLYDRLESNGVRYVLVENASRLARDLMVSEIILAQFRKLGVTVAECEGGNDLTIGDEDNPTAVLIRQILGAVSQFEKTVLVLKLRAARMRKRRTEGRCEGAKPYGERPGEAIILEKMRTLARRRSHGTLSMAEIAGVLNRAGMLNRKGKPWTGKMVWGVLKARGKGWKKVRVTTDQS